MAQQKTAIVKLVATAVPFARFVCTLTEVWLGKPAAYVDAGAALRHERGARDAVVASPAPPKFGIAACVATAAHWVMSWPKLT